MHLVIRRLSQSPMFTLAIVTVLALGIGANTAIFSVIHGVLLKPLPFAAPERLIAVWQTAPGVNIKDLNASIADYVTYREDSRTFADVAIWNGRSVAVTGFDQPERVDGIGATFRLLPMLGVEPVLGRGLTEQDSQSGSPEVVLLSYGYWQRRFGGDPKAIGKRIMADSTSREIVGVLPKGFWFLDIGHDMVLPIRYNRAEVRLASYNFQAIARLRDGVSLDQAGADVARMIAIELGKFPPPKGMSIEMMRSAGLGPNLRPLRKDFIGDIGGTLWVIMATIGIVLFIACANVANLMLVRTEGRAQELAVRAALGAGRGRIARDLLLESLLLALLGGAAGLGVAVAALNLVLKRSPVKLPRFEQISLDFTALLFALAVSILAGLIFGAVPVLRQGRAGLSMALRSGGRNASSGRERNLTRNALTVLQVALALVLLVGAGLMIRTFQSMRRVQPGFREAESLQTLRISIPRDAAPKDPEMRQMYNRLAERLGAIPGVTAVGVSNGPPMTNVRSQDPIVARDHTYADNAIPPLRRFMTAGPDAFRSLGTPLAAGREYTWADVHEERKVVLIAENFAKEYWGSAQAAVGKQIRSNPNDAWSEIVGVVTDVRHDGVDKPAPSVVYWPLRGQGGSMSYAVRSPRAGNEAFTNEIRQVVAAAAPSAPVTDMRTMKEIYDKSMARTAFTLTLLGISGGMALLLASVGIYAVISYSVAQRTREIGIRLALGARQGGLKLMFVRHGLLWCGLGAVTGLVAAAALSRLMSALLFEVKAVDPLTYVAVALALLAVAALASYLPARRVTRVDPMTALRSE